MPCLRLSLGLEKLKIWPPHLVRFVLFRTLRFTSSTTPSPPLPPPPLNLTYDARLEPPVICLTNDSNQFSIDRTFFPSRIPFKSNSNSTNITTSFSTQFVFFVLPEISSSPGFGLAFVLSASTSPSNALSGQYFGHFSGSTTPTVAPVLAIEFGKGRNPEFNDPDENHVGIDLNNIVSVITQTAGYYSASGVGNNNSVIKSLERLQTCWKWRVDGGNYRR
ncbi:L-type lectin-domain containing receptor kinase S.1 [Forsythia ovata]|uniref:L-type lectin-domain containing receptor kinase S.1 n=1 Tax=Forsythia ovata TaxID=205694 RepID=A0ABD1VHK9_9LAMI